ncbi:Ion-translocating oxidoreductase complex subunit G [Candidatus Magnetomoraceae bacterium gMMP-15]
MEPIKPMEPMSSNMLERIKNNYIVQAWLVLTLAMFFGASLAGVQLSLGPRIEANKINETLQKVPELVLGADKAQKMAEQNIELIIEPDTITIEKSGKMSLYNVYKAEYADKKPAGWVIKTKGQGYADKIELLIGVDPFVKKITGVFILEQKETPGLGNKIITMKWRGQFINKNTESPLVVTKEGAKSFNEIDAVTGATISSRSVCNIINTALSDLKAELISKD